MTDRFDPSDPLAVSQDDQGIRTFDNADIQKAIERALNSIPPGHRLASVAHATLTGASLSIVAKLGDKWSIAASCYKPYGGKMSAEAQVVWSPW